MPTPTSTTCAPARGQRDGRRVRPDLAALVQIPRTSLPDGWAPCFRRTDKWRAHDGGLGVLLPGADFDAARAALRRSGLPEQVVCDAGLRFDVARPVDFLSPFTMSTAPAEVAIPALVIAGDDSTLAG